MTCIVTDGISLAWDSYCTSDHYLELYPLQKVFIEKEAIYAIAGEVSLYLPMIEWVKKGANPKLVPIAKNNEQTCVWVFKNNKLLEVTNNRPYLTEIGAPNALGSGRRIAMGGIILGHTPEEAVWAASQCDLYTGGEIHNLLLPEQFRLMNAYKGSKKSNKANGGHARMRSLSSKERKVFAQKGAAARWLKERNENADH